MLSLLNDILGSSSLEEGSFSQEWQEVFGENETASNNRAEVQPEEESAFFLPSKLLDQDMNDLQSTVSGELNVCISLIYTNQTISIKC